MDGTKETEARELPEIPAERYCVRGGPKKFFEIILKGVDRKAVGKAFEESFEEIKKSMPDIPYERFAMSDEERRGASLQRRLEIRDGIKNTCVYTALGAGFFWAKYLSLPSVEREWVSFPFDVEGFSNPDLRDTIRFAILRMGSEDEIKDNPDPDAEKKAAQREKNGEMVLGVFSETIASKLDMLDDEIEWSESDKTIENILGRIGVACIFLFASPSFDKATGKEFFPQFIFSWDFNDGFGSFWEISIGGNDYVEEYLDKVLDFDDEYEGDGEYDESEAETPPEGGKSE